MEVKLEKSIFQTLSEVDITSKIKEKNGTKYLPWSSAWNFIKEKFPKATYEILKDERTGNNYFSDGRSCWVEVAITIGEETQHETLAVMNNRNQAIKLEEIDSVAVNKSQKRCLVKCAALFGLGLNLWYGEELSDAARRSTKEKETETRKTKAALKVVQEKVLTACKNAISRGVDKESVYNTIEAISGHKNPNSIEEIELCEAVLEAVKKMEGEK